MTLSRSIAALLVVLGVWQTASALYIPAKALLAQKLIHDAWEKSQRTGADHKPWRWADTVPVARLVAPDHRQDLIVLSGASGEALAFGPGHVSASGAPGSSEHVVIGGHRDTHFRFLQHISAGQLLELHSVQGVIARYTVESVTVVDIRQQPFVLSEDEPLLTLVTCYPFDGLSSDKRLRFVVTARRA